MTDPNGGSGRDAGGPPDPQQLLAEHLPALRAFVRLRTNQRIRDRESCTDLVQSVCRELLEGADDFEYLSDAAFRSWLFTAALRKIVARDRYWNRQQRDAKREVRGDSDDAKPLVEMYATVTTPSVVASAKEQTEQLERAFDELTEEQREIVTLAKLCGLSHAEIAEQTGRTEDACRQLLRRALIRLSRILEQAGSD